VQIRQAVMHVRKDALQATKTAGMPGPAVTVPKVKPAAYLIKN
jgi:hypothetical protein